MNNETFATCPANNNLIQFTGLINLTHAEGKISENINRCFVHTACLSHAGSHLLCTCVCGL